MQIYELLKAPTVDREQVRILTVEYYNSIPQQNNPDFNLQLIQEKLDGMKYHIILSSN